ncbi:hypothetical protein R1sor_016579 [Riccia sorocarpa]|uniref:BED-type domain-containing protein n=1 Tax=Riccia sorocarpa TaxID=122646 RepID=A0ABD3HFC5_9MARC
MGVPEPRSDLSIKVWEQYELFKGFKGNSKGVWSKCKWCENVYGTNITRLTQHFTSEFAPKNKALMELPPYKKEGSNKHIRGCNSIPDKVKLEIRELDAKQRQRNIPLAADDTGQSSRDPLDEKEEIAQALWESRKREFGSDHVESIIDPSQQVKSQHSTKNSPSSVATASTPSLSNPGMINPHVFQSIRKRTVQQPLRPLMNAQQREKADRLWGMAQAVMGLPFRVFSHPIFREAYEFSSQFSAYKFPSEKKLGTTLLDANYQTVKEDTDKKMWNHPLWKKATISCDGWTNANGRPQVNILFINRYGEKVHRHVDGSNATKSADWIANHIIEDIQQVGPTNVLQFVADNAACNILAGKLVRKRFPHVVFGGCVAHGIDLLFEDIGKLPWVKDVVQECRAMVSFIKNHHIPHTMFLDHFSNGAALLKPNITRFATNVIMLDRAWYLAECLRQMVVSERWHRWNMWTNIIQTTAMLLYPAHLFDEERQETSVHAFIMRHFKKYVRLFGEGVLEKKGDDLEDWINDVHGELDGIACQDASIWTVEHKEKALSSEVKSQPMLWWGQAGRATPNLRIIAMNILGLTTAASVCERAWSSYAFVHSKSRVRLSIQRQHKLVYIYHNARIKSIDQKRKRKSARALNIYWKSNVQQSILKRQYGVEYGASRDPKDAWIPDEILDQNGPDILTSTGEKVKIKTWDWREPVTEEEVLENMEEDRRRRAEGSVELDSPTPQRQHHDDLQDYDFPCDENEPLEDASTLPDIDIGDGDTLDEHMNIASLFMRRESVRNYKMVDYVGAAQARAHGVEEDRLKELNSKFGIEVFPKVKLNAPGVELTSKKTRVLQDIYSFPVVRDDTQSVRITTFTKYGLFRIHFDASIVQFWNRNVQSKPGISPFLMVNFPNTKTEKSIFKD